MSPSSGGWQPVVQQVVTPPPPASGWQPVVQPPQHVYVQPPQHMYVVSSPQEPPRERIVEVEVVKEVPIEKVVVKEVPVVKEVEVIKEVIKEVPVERIVYVDRIKEVEVIREVTVEVPVEKIVYRDREVEVPVPVEKVVYRDREVHVHVPSVGLGMRIGGSTNGDGPFFVEEVIQGYAAARTGDIFPGDEIVRIDGRSIPSVGGIKAMTIGPAGTQSCISLRRDAGPVFDVTMTRVSPTWDNTHQYDMHSGGPSRASY